MRQTHYANMILENAMQKRKVGRISAQSVNLKMSMCWAFSMIMTLPPGEKQDILDRKAVGDKSACCLGTWSYRPHHHLLLGAPCAALMESLS